MSTSPPPMASSAADDTIPPPAMWLTERHMRLPDGTFPHLGTTDGDVAPVALLSGSPDRVELMASMLDDVRQVGARRGYSVYTGTGAGGPVTVATSGVGAPSLSIAMEELAACGARTFVRVGSCASISPLMGVGGIAIAHGAVCDEGTSRYYAPSGYPAVAAPRVLDALRRAAGDEAVDCAVGLTRTTDSFYEGERTEELIGSWSARRVLAFEMETSALFTIAGVMGWEAGSIICAGSNLLTGEATYRGQSLERYQQGQADMLRVALAAAALLQP
ncbi:nucleoside phosphorylase [Dermatobacter hominis]|uniref:nucleoside phosphorylase n=1 Tax=Dermatobacter hominis TaxID=2884263 RepID=UPI001D11A9FD|nr:nucleoside phosphorylase [Dermatobacter hominis]UDY36831.1 nucleoside phosphorylase [Dermatobacter hominis]